MSSSSGRRRPADRGHSWHWPTVSAVLGVGAYILTGVLRGSPALVETVYTRGLWSYISRPISLASGAAPFMVGEVLVALYVLWLAALIVAAVRALVRRQRSVPNLLAGGVRRTLRDAGILVFLFYLVWGLNYARAPFEARMGWPAWQGADADELTVLAAQATAEANRAYLELHGTTDAGAPTTFADVREFEAELDEGWSRVAELLDLMPATAERYSRVKRPWSSTLLPRFGISGMYVPFTAEAIVPRGMPAVAAAQAMAHEKAHQRGVTNEGEATFLGFLAGSLSDHPLARYAAAVAAQSQLLSALRRVAPDSARALHNARLPGIGRDLSDVREFYLRYRGVGQLIGAAVNDRYLRANRVPGGSASYGYSVRLLIEFARQHAGEIPGWREPGSASTSPAARSRP